jgi:glucose-6-phosphate isomerase
MVLQTASQQDAKHFVAVSTNIEKVTALVLIRKRFFQWIGRRSFFTVEVGLTVGLAIGYDNFEELLAGANQMEIILELQILKVICQ